MTRENKNKIKALETEIIAIEDANRAETQYQLFRGQDLTGRDFSGQDLTGCNFREAILDNCNFTGCLLHYANFKDASTTGAIFDQTTKTSGSAWLVRIPKSAANARSRSVSAPLNVDDSTPQPGSVEIDAKKEAIQAIIDNA